MMIRFALAMVVAVSAFQVQAAENLALDADKSKIEFVGKKTDGKHVGGFKSFKAKAVADFEQPAASKLEIVIDTPSIWSDNDKLTNHLKNPDFFDVRKHPKITFTSTKISTTGEGTAAGEETATISGDLTMLGKTVPVTIPAKVDVSDEQVQITATFKLDRTKWGMNYGVGNIENDVDVKATLVFTR